MAQVPFSGVPDVAESDASIGRQDIRATPEAFGGGIGEGLADIGGNLMKRGEMLATHAIAFQQQNNQIAVDDAYTKFLDGANDISLKYRSLTGSDAMNGYQGAHDSLMSLRDQLSGTLPNQAARIQFDSDSRRLAAMQADALATHAAQQRLTFIKDQKNAIVTAATTAAIVNMNDPHIVADSIATAWHAWDQANPGAAPEVQAAGHQLVTSNIYSGIVQRMLANGDTIGANAFFQKHISEFTPDKIGALDNALKPSVKADELANGISTIMHGYLGAPPKPEDFHAAIRDHGEMTPDGRMSKAGAAGPNQLLASTAQAMAVQLGMPWDPQKWAHGEKKPDGSVDWSYNEKLGDAYADNQMRMFNNPALAALAYESGPGNVKKAIEQFGDPRTGAISMDDFLDKYKAAGFPEGAAYARRVAGALQGKPGTPATSPDPKAHLQDWLAEADSYAAYARPGDPGFARDLEAGLTAEVGRQQKAIDDTRAIASQNITSLLIGGPDLNAKRPTSLNEMYQMDPNSRIWMATLKPSEQAHVLRQLADNATGRLIPATPETEALTRRLLGEANNDPNTFLKENLNEYQLPAKDMTTLNNLQRKLLTKPQPNEDIKKALGIAKIFGAADVLSDMTSDQAHQFTGGLMQSIQGFENVHKRKPNDSDIKQMTQDLMMEDATASSFFHTAHVYESGYASQITQVPVPERAAITASFQKKFGKEPTPGEIVYWYGRAHAH